MLDLAKNNIFPKKNIYYGNNHSQKKTYTPILNFYKHTTKFDKKPSSTDKFDFKCQVKDCPKTLLASFGAVTNLKTHLQRHVSLNECYKIYLKQKDSIKRSFITEPQLNFVKLWISSKSTLELINNNFPRLCLKDEIKLP